MWATLTVLAALGAAPGRAGELTLSHVRSTHGVLGPTRAGHGVLPGGSLVLSFDIEGMAPDDSGRVRYAMRTEVTNAAGRVVFRQDSPDLEATLSLGGTSVPAFARLDVGLNQPPGEYTLRLTVTDRATGRTGSLTRTNTLRPPDFGLVRLALSSDPDGQFPAPVYGAGQPLWVSFAAVGFARARDGGQPDVAFNVLVRDQDGKPTLPRPLTSAVDRDVPDRAVSLPLHFLLSLNRPGRFTLEVTATDRVARKTAKLSVPLTVLPVK